MPAFASLSCIHRAHHSPARIRHLWCLASLALVLWTLGAVLSAREEFFLHANADVGGNSQIVYFLYGIPLLVAIAAPTESQWSALFVTMDGFQVLIMGLATYALIFNVVPFTHQRIEPVSSQVVALAFNIENVVLACASTLRFRASPAAEEDRHFFRSLAIFLWVYAAFAALYNHVVIVNPGPMGFYNVVQDLPFLSWLFWRCSRVVRNGGRYAHPSGRYSRFCWTMRVLFSSRRLSFPLGSQSQVTISAPVSAPSLPLSPSTEFAQRFSSSDIIAAR
jgi:hypothetical protein